MGCWYTLWDTVYGHQERTTHYSSWTSLFRLFSLSHYGYLLPIPSPCPFALMSLEVVWGSGDIWEKETAAGHFHTGCCSKRQWSARRHYRWPNHGGICSNSAEQFTNDYSASTGTPKTPFVFLFLHFQPGCVNTTEVDIKKSSRMRNPHKTRKVNRCVSCGLAEVSTFNTSISKNPSQCCKHTSPWDSTLIIPFLGRCKQHLPLFVRSQWQTKVHSTSVCPGEPNNLLGCLTEHG